MHQHRLDIQQMKEAHTLGNARALCARGNGVKDAKLGPQDGALTDVWAMGAEIALAHMLGVAYDRSISPRSGSHDLDYKGWRIDVKWTKYQSGKLLACLADRGKDKADVYALMVGDWPTYRFAGWAWAEDLLDDSNRGDLGHGPGFMLEQRDLNTHKLPERKDTT